MTPTAKTAPEIPYLTLLLTAVLMLLALLQLLQTGYFSFMLLSSMGVDASARITLGTKMALALLVFGAGVLVFRRQRLGVYLLELVTLYSLVSLMMVNVKLLLLADDMLGISHWTQRQWLGWAVVQMSWALMFIGYLWCLRGDKTMAYVRPAVRV